ncbi:deubiquitinase OTUD6B isoform X2 [Sinocyclocheilus grahami]|uniref:ubiquitinyl hydrolase 1 n=1 Tax=Sinocyclocheilus grahami TaxID=75366 RepID=A0A672S845_SINGR|nr:PREDICTED: OTU domain-containing protein 6B isoform X1 [Sinocyclocheilus grahami]XP_016094899.1 PREDICTED: OTU domain-containing protein 6B isoform X2 [Sinocyclocheilus grahami]
MEEVETAEELLAKQHRKEKKDLQAKIQIMKNAVPKNDKKRRKQLTEDIAKLEAELTQKHENELEQLQNSSSVEEASNAMDSVSLANDEEKTDSSKQTRTSKAQKRRDKKAALEKERDSRIAEAEVENLTGSRHQEGLKLRQKLMERHLQIREISSDGHCMYRAVEDQLTERGAPLSLKELRAQTAQYMRSHADDFLPFLTDPNSGDMYTADEFEKYCNDVADTAAWGGQLELKALSQVLQLPIEVIQAESPSINIGEEYDKPPITLVYMRHAYGLGEHYNSVEPLKDLANEEEG